MPPDFGFTLRPTCRRRNSVTSTSKCTVQTARTLQQSDASGAILFTRRLLKSSGAFLLRRVVCVQPLLERPVSFRLSAEAYRKYEASAAQIGMRLSQYLRFRLETEDSVSGQLSQLRLTLLDAGS